MGKPLSTMFRGLEADLDAAAMKIHPEVYFSMIGFISIISIIVPALLLTMLFTFSALYGIIIFPLNFLAEAPITLRILGLLSIIMTPLFVIFIGSVVPKLSASNRSSKLKNEIPYASMYMSVMTSGGLSPYQSLIRMTDVNLLPTIQQEMMRLQSLVLSSGSDPISAMEKAVKVLDVREYKRLLLGYATTVRRGGDVLHYLYTQTEGMFQNLSVRTKAMGEHLSIIMEANIIVSILGVLGLIMIFVVSLSLPAAGMTITIPQFYLFSFAVLPMISILFIYAGDAVQISQPMANWKPYLYALLGLPLGIFIVSQTTLPSLFDFKPVLPQLLDIIRYFTELVKLGEGTDAAMGLALGLLSISIAGGCRRLVLRWTGQEGLGGSDSLHKGHSGDEEDRS
jgi:flagellar protein FlaJ